MLPVDAFHQFLLLLPFTYPGQAPVQTNTITTTPVPTTKGFERQEDRWDYSDTHAWVQTNPQCNGYRQSPIHIKTTGSTSMSIPPLTFGNYDLQLAGKLTLINNGHTVNMQIPVTKNGNRPYIRGGLLEDKYEAIGLHFHWGAPGVKGSEHMINNNRYDVEMHIVHKNKKYATEEQARQFSDGLAVLSVMFKMVYTPDRFYPGLNKVFNTLPQLIRYKSEAKISGPLTLGQMIGDLKIKDFYTYSGSLTTPPCSESVMWHVFPEPLLISYAQIQKFWNLLDINNNHMVANFRPLQQADRRPVLRRTLNHIHPIFASYPEDNYDYFS